MKPVIILDYDGTIVNSGTLVHKAFNIAAAKYYIKPLATFRGFANLYNTNVYDAVIKYGVSQGNLSAFFREWRNNLTSLSAKIHLFRGMRNMLKQLSKKAYLAIISSNMSDVIRNSLKDLGVKSIQDIVGGEINMSKVAKIRLLKKRFHKASFYYVGDTVGDIIEGRKARVKTIAVTWGFHSKAKLKRSKPDFIVNKPEELMKIFS